MNHIRNRRIGVWIFFLIASISARAELVTFQKAASGSPVKIICFGDSVTGLYYHTGGRRTYTDLLGDALRRAIPNAKVEMRNAGSSGHTTVNALGRIERDVIAHKPELVTVMFGLNDMVRVPLDAYRANLVMIVEKCRAAGAEVVLCTPNAITDNTARPTKKLLEYCAAVRSVAAEFKVPLCDAYSDFDALRKRDYLKWRLLMSDDIHPNLAGHQFIAERIASVIAAKPVDLENLVVPSPAIPRTIALRKSKKPIQVLAMPPFDKWIVAPLAQGEASPKPKVISWDVVGKTLPQIEQDASGRVRKLKPNLVIIAVPRSAAAKSVEEFIHAHTWIANWSLSFDRQVWDCVIVHPSVADPEGVDPEKDDLIRKLAIAADLALIDRKPGDQSSAEELFTNWLRAELGIGHRGRSPSQ